MKDFESRNSFCTEGSFVQLASLCKIFKQLNNERLKAEIVEQIQIQMVDRWIVDSPICLLVFGFPYVKSAYKNTAIGMLKQKKLNLLFT